MDKQEHFVKNIEIKNFKCFDDFKAEGFGRVNLIGGKNNVGKSTLLEALYINLNSKNEKRFLNAIFKISKNRDNFFALNNLFSQENIFKFYKILFTIKSTSIKNYKKNDINYISTNNFSINFEFIEEFTGLKINYQIDNKESNENIAISLLKDIFKRRIKTEDNILFVKPIGLDNEYINEFYENIQKLDKEDELNQSLAILDNSIKKFKIMNQEPVILQNNEYLLVTQLGDGAKQLINIFISIYSSKNGVLLIDEIDNGFHYTFFDKLWKIILTISKEQNVQVFATTHSKECIESYARVSKKLEDEEITFIELGKNKKDELKAMIYSYEWLIDEIEQNHEVRGW